MKQAVILAGGKGTRLAERLNGRPKPLVDVDGVPLLERQVTALAAFGIREVVLLVNHAANQIERFFAERGDLGCRVRLIDDGVPAGTAGATLACLDHLADRFLVVYGDTLFDIDITRFIAAHDSAGADATLFLHPNDHPHDSDLVELEASGRVKRFHSYPHPENAWLPNLVNAAFYAIEKKALLPWLDFKRPSDFAKDLFPAMVKAGAHLHGYRSFEYIKDLGTPKRLDKVEQHLRSGLVARASWRNKQKVVFLDRDGTLNVQRDFVRKPDELELIPGAEAAIKAFNDCEFRTALVTNQPIIARGDASVETLDQIHAKLETLLGAQGSYLDAIYYCPHHPDSGFLGEVSVLKIKCACRKPRTQMLERGAADLNANLAQSFMVGDSTADILVGARMGVQTILVRTGNGGRDGKYECTPDYIVDDIAGAAHLITVLLPRLSSRAQALLDAVKPGDLVVIGGFARSGKSTSAAWLAAALRERAIGATRVALDRWILPPDQRGFGVMGRFDVHSALDTLRPWLSGNALDAQTPTYDRYRRCAGPTSPLRANANDVVIVEGVPALALDWTATQRRVHCVYVDADESARAVRLKADLILRKALDAQTFEQIYAARADDENAFIQTTRIKASHILTLDEQQQ